MDKLKNNSFSISTQYSPVAMGDGIVLNFKAVKPLGDDKEQSVQSSKYILIMLDVSGSMSGSPIDTCKLVLIELLKYIHNELNSTNVDLGVFTAEVKIADLQGKPLDYCLGKVDRIKAGGGTRFIPVFEKIQEIVREKGQDNVCVVLLSDGQAERMQEIQPQIEKMKRFMQMNTRSAEFHTLGFGYGHDAQLLSAITNSGTSQGTFQYIKSASEITLAMEAVSGFFGQNNFGAVLNYGKNDQKIFFEGEDDPFADEQIWNGFTFLELSAGQFEEAKDDMYMIIKDGKEESVIKLEPIIQDITDPASKIKYNLQSLNHTLKQITTKLTNQKVTAEEAEEINLKINSYRKTLEQITKDIFKLKIAEREPLFGQVGDLTEYLNTFTGLLTKNFLGQLNNDQIANLNSLAYRDIARKGLLKKLDKRAAKSVPIINEAFEKVKELSKNVDSDELEKKYEDHIHKFGTCMLTCYNFIEAMADEDCLCMTFDLNRPEIAIADCTRINIKKIYPTIISAKSFMDCAKYSVKLNAKASGGFDEDSKGSIIKGVSNEDITGVLPLFICKEHWDIATLLMKPILGWVITLDPVGYSYFQKLVLPFMLLSHAVEMKTESPDSEFANRCHDMLLETCHQILRDDANPDFGGTLREEFLQNHQNYLTDGTVRTVDVIQSNFVHLSLMYAYWKMGVIEKPTRQDLMQTLHLMIEEELRRRQEAWKPDRIEENVIEFLGVDVKKYEEIGENLIAEHSSEIEESKVQEIAQDLNDNEMMFLMELERKNPSGMTAKEKISLQNYRNKKKIGGGGNDNKSSQSRNLPKADDHQLNEENKVSDSKESVTEEKKASDIDSSKKEEAPIQRSPIQIIEEELKIPLSEIVKGDQMRHLTSVQKKAFDYYQDLYKSFYKDLFKWFKFFYPEDKDFNLDDYNALFKVGFDTPSKFMALFLQNQIQQKNADRKSAFQSGRHQNPWKQQLAESALQRSYTRVIVNAIKRKLKKKTAAQTNASSIADFFAYTDSLEDAAGLLLGTDFSLGAYQSLLYLMRTSPEHCLKMKEKLMMLKHSEYRGVEFLPVTFHLRKGGLKKVWKKFCYDYSYNEWKELWY